MRRPLRAVSVQVSRREFVLLQRLAFQAKRTGGRKLAANAILRALIRLMKALEVDLTGVKSAAELRKRLLAAKPRRKP